MTDPVMGEKKPTPFWLRAIYGYSFAVALTVLTITARIYLFGIFGTRAGYILFFPAVVSSSILFGFGPGIVVTLIAAAWSWKWFSDNSPSGHLEQVDIVSLSVFVVTSASIAFLCEWTRRADRAATKAVVARLRAEQSQQMTEGRLSAVFGQSVVGVATTDLAGRFQNVNQRLCSLLGYCTDDLVGRGLYEITHADDVKRNLDHFHRLIADGTPYTLDKRYIRKDGTSLWVNKSVSLVRDPNGQPQACVIVVIDISDSVAAREMLVRQAHERERALTGERAAREEAERANRLKDEFLATLSHELRTPLNAILGWAQILNSNARANTVSPQHLAEGLSVIERNARAQTQLIEDLLDMSRVISGKLRLEELPVDLPAVIHAAVDVVRPAAKAKQIVVTLDLADRPVGAGACVGDANRIQQVVWNLLSNAVKFTPAGGGVAVSLTYVDNTAQIAVSDTGQGIEPTFLPRVFDRFSQADGSTTRRHGGLGIGLAIVKQLTELHGGTVDVHSAGLGSGTTFFVRLPLHATNRSIAPSPKAPPASELVETRALAGTHVLFVENEADTRDLVSQIIRGGGATVTAVGSADEAVDVLSRVKADVLLCDIGMPDRDGYDLIRQIRGMSDRSIASLPAIALTAFARPEDRTRAANAGFDAHLAKPVEPATLIRALAQFAVSSAA